MSERTTRPGSAPDARARRRRAGALGFFAVALSSSLALAQAPAETSAPPPPAYQTTVHARPKRDDSTPQIVMTARELKERGALTLADALALIPELQVRQGGNGIRLDLRGAKQFSVLVLIDGVPITEPYFGIFDLSAIPITDIVEVRVQLSPASPLEGPGGDGGIVEIFTLRALGGKMVNARAAGGSTPEGEVAVTGRTPIGETVGVRTSAGARLADPSYPVTSMSGMASRFSELQWNAYGSARLERQSERSRLTADLWYGHRSFFIPPSDTAGSSLQHVTAEDAARLVVGGDFERHGLRVAVGAYGELVARATDLYADYAMTGTPLHQDLLSGRFGSAGLVDKPFRVRGLVGTVSARLSVDGDVASIKQSNGAKAWGTTEYSELAVGTKLRWRWLSVEAAAGVLLPFERASTTWPEGKLVVGFHPHRAVDVLLIGARKGRLPTLRELYDPRQGAVNNTVAAKRDLQPEQTWHAEVQLQVHPHKLVGARFSGYVRRIDGLIRIAPGGMYDQNLGSIDVRGLETGFDVARDQLLGGGMTYMFQDAYSGDPAILFDGIPNLPRHRVDAYLSSTWRHRIGGIIRFDWTAERVVQQTLLPRFWVMELDVWARIWKNLRGSVRIDNLTNNSYLLLPGLQALGTTATVTLEGTWP